MLRINWSVIPARESHPGVISQRYEGDGMSIVRYRLDAKASLPLLILADELMVVVQRGQVKFNIGEDVVELKPGDLCRIPSRTPYGASTGTSGCEMLVFIGRRRESQQAQRGTSR